ncbi:hypothetical protein CDAR_283471 [Caerostris darwini]|uniref:Uncharacterized protein n=1 Tax=Caerostris darwini TaxID=1538125 RepID=A0AAV4SN89_9ARAC|nr:hypothetical protein CDAR_283471 [Caerostris darwini]
MSPATGIFNPEGNGLQIPLSWNATNNHDSVSRRDTSKKRHSPQQRAGFFNPEEMDFVSFSWILRKGDTPPRRDILQQNRIFNRRNGLQILQLECYEKL